MDLVKFVFSVICAFILYILLGDSFCILRTMYANALWTHRLLCAYVAHACNTMYAVCCMLYDQISRRYFGSYKIMYFYFIWV